MRSIIKRLLDALASALALTILAPLLLAIAAAIWGIIGRPVLWRQARPGLNGKPFMLIKFRTMSNAKGPDGALLPDALRLGRFGRFLRRFSLDELPELLNVLRGDMSLVGPRPLLMEYLDRYTAEQSRRHNVRPGITGWAQINGRNAIAWEQKFALDIWYVDNQSFWLDLRILILTLWKVLKCEGISEPGHATMSEFMGKRS
jgi:sugar transferase EpsL